MSEEKQIEEMADEQIGEMSAIIYTGGVLGKTSVDIAKILYAKCYRKQSEGEWKIMKIGDGNNVRTCSACYISQSVNVYKDKVMFRYCPYCGAKMKGGESK